ncbi:SDR family oxidoreductase [Pelagibius litoralis]|uniref:SDR family oxidoreductase n=1 Tax=Pelagibius litoralis TaxID=374515 RepID=A0A967EYW7_9PROT|nr:SDR family oxidoreductase [Pelagibius litoralis]
MAGLFDLSGRVACVTGASSGIGRRLATALAEAGATVVGVARRQDQLDAWLTEAEAAGGRGLACVADLADLAALEDIAARIAEAGGAPDILVNAAGLNTRQAADAVTAEGWQRTLDLNLSAPFFLAQALVPAMRARGWGRIINLASLQSERAFAGGIAYGTSKGGVVQMTRAMAEAWSRDGITCNALAPGFFPTELTAAVFDDAARAERNAAQTCIGRNGKLDDLVGPAVFLASPASDYVTGQTLFVDGGFTAK